MKRVITPSLWACIVALATITPAFGGSLGEANPEIWIDGPLAVKPGNDPRAPAASTNRQGQQIFVWDSGGTGDGLDVYLRMFDSGGIALFDPVLVNTFIENNQLNPELAVSEDGSFLVIWQSFEPPMPGDNFRRIIIRSQAFDADAQALGTEQILSSVKTLIATTAEADVTALADGNYVVVWESSQSANMADNSQSIQARRVDASGVPIGDQFQINSLMNGTLESDPSATPLADGGFLVTWARPEIHGRRFNQSAVPQGDDFQINTIVSARNRLDPSAATRDNGDVLVTWGDLEDASTGSEIRGRLYNAQLVALGSDFRINTLVADAQTVPSAAGYGDGFFVIWESIGSVGSDLEPHSIEGRIVTGSNVFATPQFLVNEFTPVSQENPDIGGQNGYVAMAWLSRSNEVTSENVILGQSWNVCGIFCDSFE